MPLPVLIPVAMLMTGLLVAAVAGYVRGMAGLFEGRLPPAWPYRCMTAEILILTVLVLWDAGVLDGRTRLTGWPKGRGVTVGMMILLVLLLGDLVIFLRVHVFPILLDAGIRRSYEHMFPMVAAYFLCLTVMTRLPATTGMGRFLAATVIP